MTDALDRAAKLEAQHRQRALRQALDANREPEQQQVAGVVLCIDCDEPVQPARLLAKPNAARCIHCQGLYERKSVHG